MSTEARAAQAESVVVHAELAQFASQRVATPAKQSRSVLAAAACLAESDSEESTLEFRNGVVQQSCRTASQSRFRPLAQCAAPVAGRIRRAATRSTEVRRYVGRRDLASRRRHRESSAGVNELAHIAGPIEGDQTLLRVLGGRLALHPKLACRHRKIVTQEFGNIRAPLAQRRDLDPDHV